MRRLLLLSPRLRRCFPWRRARIRSSTGKSMSYIIVRFSQIKSYYSVTCVSWRAIRRSRSRSPHPPPHMLRPETSMLYAADAMMLHPDLISHHQTSMPHSLLFLLLRPLLSPHTPSHPHPRNSLLFRFPLWSSSIPVPC